MTFVAKSSGNGFWTPKFHLALDTGLKDFFMVFNWCSEEQDVESKDTVDKC